MNGVIDVDNQRVGGINLNFSEMVEQQLKKAGQAGDVPEEEGNIDDAQLTPEAYKCAEPLVPTLTFPLLRLFYGKQFIRIYEKLKNNR